eukprot:scaffold5223_cov138-Cylindrotheca_fusiformis.AAC.2
MRNELETLARLQLGLPILRHAKTSKYAQTHPVKDTKATTHKGNKGASLMGKLGRQPLKHIG